MMDIGNILLFSGKILVITSVTNLFFGTVTGVFLSRRRTLLVRLIDVLISLPLVFPPIAFGFFLVILLGRYGFIGKGFHHFFSSNIILTPVGVIIASFFAGFPLMVRSVKSVASVLNPSIIEAANLQGATRIQTIFYIIIPNVKNGILTGLTLSACRSLGEVGMTLLLGGNIAGKTETISLAIFNAVFEGNFEKAALLSCLLGGISVIFLIGIQNMEKVNPINHF